MERHEVSRRRKGMLETKQLVDCKFKVGKESEQEIIEAHKMILAMSSPVFKAMFFGEMAERNNTIRVTDIQPMTFKALLNYIYTENIILESFELACGLCYCANKYNYPFLEAECTNFVLRELSVERVCRAYELFKLLEKLEPMIKCMKIIREQTNQVLRQPSFEKIEFKTLLWILEQDELRINSEIDLFYATERWAEAECIRRGLYTEDPWSMRSVLGESLSKIRFLTLTSEELAEISANSSLLEATEIVAISQNIGPNMGQPVYMPRGFSTNKTKRDLQITVIYGSGETIRNNGNEIGNRREYYCNRGRIGNFSTDTFICYDTHTSFTVDKRIWLIGIRIPSQIRSDDSSYTESLEVGLRESLSSYTMVRENFKANVTPKTLFEVTFRHRKLIDANKEYTLTITFDGVFPRTFPKNSYLSERVCESVLFKFNGYSALSESQDLIASIIFTPYSMETITKSFL